MQGLLLSAVAVGALIAFVSLFLPLGVAGHALALGLALAPPAVVLIATGRAQALRLAVDVGDGQDKTDGGAAVYLVTKLSDLGSGPPVGLKVPSPTDVTALPAEALTSLPTANYAKILFGLLQAVRPGVPWQVKVVVNDTLLYTVELRRNGRAAGSATINGTQLFLDDRSSASEIERRMLTATAAWVLMQLADRHHQLRSGLAGATRWRSVALHAIGTGRDAAVTGAQSRTLFAAAVAEDPGNALARVASFVSEAGKAVPRADVRVAQDRLVKKAGQEHKRIASLPGSRALDLRLAFVRAAGLTNLILLGDNRAADAWCGARCLVTALEGEQPSEIHDLRNGLRVAAYFLVHTLHHLDDRFLGGPDLVGRIKPWLPDRDGPLAGRRRYDRACWRATTRTLPADATPSDEAALDDLDAAIAVGSPEMREWARVDPSFDGLRVRALAKFREIVGDPPPADFFELPRFHNHRDGLRALGILEPADLIAADPERVQRHTGIGPQTLATWKDIARLTVPGTAPRGEGVPLGLLGACVDLGVTSRDQLRAKKAANDWVTWNQEVEDKTTALSVTPDKQEWDRYL